jgi:hypothetical protein
MYPGRNRTSVKSSFTAFNDLIHTPGLKKGGCDWNKGVMSAHPGGVMPAALGINP